MAKLPRHIRAAIAGVNAQALKEPVAVLCASELLASGRNNLPAWSSASETRYLLIADVPEPALVRLPRILGVRRPDYRMYVTRDAGTIHRLIIGLSRRQPVLGIVDAYPLGGEFHVLTADFELRCFPIRKLPILARLGAADLAQFSVDEDGSYLHWPAHDLHIGVSQLLQEVDPAFMADVAMERNEYDNTGVALRAMREERSLKQSEIPGISARQVSRVEAGVSRLRYSAAQKFAAAFGMETGALLDQLGRRASALFNVSHQARPLRLKQPESDVEPTGCASK
ncbi:MAG TPA: DUF2442 domain-containing protein [Longimicrobium sp.]|nr:DUF2442 domain-containing protein [Longimicrobium sp.]